MRRSMVLTRNTCGQWDRTRGFEDWRIHQPCDCSLPCFLPVQNVCRPRGRVTSQTVSQTVKMVVILGAAVPSPSLYVQVGMMPKPETPPGEQADHVTNGWTDLNSFRF